MAGEAKKRDDLKKVYPGPRWAEKVDRMSDKQVAAIHYRLVQQKKI
jgi:hypothetical protein